MADNSMFHRLMGTTRNVININQTQTGGDNIVQAQSINITQTISGDGNTVVGITVNDGSKDEHQEDMSEDELAAKTDLFEKTSEGGIAMSDVNLRIAEGLINQAHEDGYITKKVYDSGLTKDQEEEVARMTRELHEGQRKEAARMAHKFREDQRAAEKIKHWKVHNIYGISNNTNVLGETIGEFYWVYDEDGEVCLEQNCGNTVKHYYHLDVAARSKTKNISSQIQWDGVGRSHNLFYDPDDGQVYILLPKKGNTYISQFKCVTLAKLRGKTKVATSDGFGYNFQSYDVHYDSHADCIYKIDPYRTLIFDASMTQWDIICEWVRENYMDIIAAGIGTLIYFARRFFW